MMVYEVDNNGLKSIRTWSTKYSLTLKAKYSLASQTNRVRIPERCSAHLLLALAAAMLKERGVSPMIPKFSGRYDLTTLISPQQ